MKCLGDRGRVYHCKILLLDGTELIQEVQSFTTGQQLVEVVNKHLNLVETVYFGLRYVDGIGQTHWLDPNKKVCRQLKGNNSFTLYFGVKFYASDPCKLVEEITRYQFFLQVKQDVVQGRLPVPFELAAELAAFAVQSELGDYDMRRHSPGYVSEFHFVAAQTEDLENRIADIHKTLAGQVPATAELNYLEKVKWLDMYGVDLHPVLGEDNIEYFLGLTPSGVIVLRNKTKVGNYFWPRITKVYFKGRYFMLRVRDKNNDESTYGFELPTKQACKHLWKCCVEHHAFFRLMQVSTTPVSGLFRLTSKFRYSGQTVAQNRDTLSLQRLPPQVMRVPSQRGLRRLPPTDGIDNSLNDVAPKLNGTTPSANLGLTSGHRASSVPVVLPLADSPRSVRSAPWSGTKPRGLYSSSTNPSPRSVRSANTKNSARLRNARQSSSVDSESSYDGRHNRSVRNHFSLELKPSSRGSRNRSKKSRSNSRNRDSGSESESQHKRHRSRNRPFSDELVQCETQWRHNSQSHSANIKEINPRRSGYLNSGMESESEANYRQKRKQRRHGRSRSHSPSDNQKRPPEELQKHFEYKLVESSGMSEEQLKDIPYTKVDVSAKPFKVKHSGNGARHNRSRSDRTGRRSPPLPYTGDELEVAGYSSARSQMSSTPRYKMSSALYTTNKVETSTFVDANNRVMDAREFNHEMSTEL